MDIWNIIADAGNDDLSARTVVMSTGNNGVLVRSVLMSVGISCVWVYPKFSLEAGNQQSSRRSGGTHVKGTKDPIKVQPPGSNRFFIVFCMIASRDQIPFTPFDDVPLNLGHSPDWGTW